MNLEPFETAVSIASLSILFRYLRTRKWTRTDAEVISLGRAYSADDALVHQTMVPVLRYRTTVGSEIVLHDRLLRFGPAVVKDMIPILYCPDRPSCCVPISKIKRFRVELVVIVFALIPILESVRVWKLS